MLGSFRYLESPTMPHDLEHDLHGLTSYCVDETFAQNLYAALCNMPWIHVATGQVWSCSWRCAGGIVANRQGEGDYMTWYCSGIDVGSYDGYVCEGEVAINV